MKKLSYELELEREATGGTWRSLAALKRVNQVFFFFLNFEFELGASCAPVAAEKDYLMMDDIEETTGSISNDRAPKKQQLSTTSTSSSSNQSGSSTLVPGTGNVWVKTFGCSHNVSDSEYMCGILQAYGYSLVNNKESASIWVINSCTVKDPSQAAFMNIVHEAKEKDIALVVAGCVPQGDRKVKGLENVSVVGVMQIDRIVEVVEETIKGNVVRMLKKESLPSLDLPKIRRNPLVEIIPLSTGCLGNCTYCKTKHARGKLGSYR